VHPWPQRKGCRMSQPNGLFNNLRLYQVLGLRRTDATAEDVKRAYRKTATRVHPDRNRGDVDSTAKFQEVQHAYSVLSEERLRSVYDSYGEQGLEMYKSYVAFAESDEGGPALPVGDPAMLIIGACCLLGIAVGLVTASCVTIYLKLQGDTSASLAALLTPLWLIDVIVIAVLLATTTIAYRRGLPMLTSGRALAQGILFVVWQVLLVLRVDEDVAPASLPFGVVFVPFYVLESLFAVDAIYKVRPSTYDTERAAAEQLPPYPLHVARALSGTLARAAALVLIALKLDETVTVSWALVLLPLWLLLALELALALAETWRLPASQRDQAHLILTRASVGGLLFAALLLLFTTLVLDGTLTSWLPIFLVAFVLAGCFFCCCTCVVCAVNSIPKATAVDVPPSDEYGGSATSSRSSSSKAEGSTPMHTPASVAREKRDSDRSQSPPESQANESAPLLRDKRANGGVHSYTDVV